MHLNSMNPSKKKLEVKIPSNESRSKQSSHRSITKTEKKRTKFYDKFKEAIDGRKYDIDFHGDPILSHNREVPKLGDN
jgi:hypothetical protein